MKNFTFTFLIISVLMLSSCGKDDQKATTKKDSTKQTASTTDKETNAGETKTEGTPTFSMNNFGSYVDDQYAGRESGSDWVSVTVKPLNVHRALVSVRSRGDKMKPSCTIDAVATIEGPDYLVVPVELGLIKLNFAKDAVTISKDDATDESVLTYYCRGGASLGGTYKKINEELDQKEIDKRVYVSTLQMKGNPIMFFVEQTGNELTITPNGLKTEVKPITETIDGTIINSEIADLNADGSPEIYIYSVSGGSGSYGKVIGYSVNNGMSVTPITMPDITTDPKASEGYMGHDEFAVVENRLVRRFPFYKPNDTNANPTGGTKQIQYKLENGEATWQLVVDKIVVY